MALDFHQFPSAASRRDIPGVIVTPDTPIRGVFYFFHGITRLPATFESLAGIYHDRVGLQRLADFHGRAIVAPFLGRTFGIDSEIDPTIRYATFLTAELPPLAEAKLGRSFTRLERALTGFSMGGYAALNALCRAPESFAVAAVHGAVTDPAHGIHDLHWDTAGPAEEAFGPYWENPGRYHVNSPFTLVNRLANRRDVAIGLQMGLGDFLLPTHRRFRARLEQVGILHGTSELPGPHRCETREMASLFGLAELLADELAPAPAT